MLGLALLGVFPASARSQDAGFALSSGDFAAGIGAAAVFVAPSVLNINQAPADCGPCPRKNVPFFDRWAIGRGSPVAARAGDVGVAALALATWWDLAREGVDPDLVASLESAAWAAAAAELLKAAIARKRPVLYGTQARAAVNSDDSQRSLPSVHTSTAFALATSYILTRGRLYREGALSGRNLAAVATATLVGILRVAGGRHFPSDVVAGAALGAASAIVVHKIKF